MLKISSFRRFSTKVAPYFQPTMSIAAFKNKFAYERELNEGAETVKIGGRVIGKRLASSTLIFLDLESNGERVQVVLNERNIEGFPEMTLKC